MEELLRFSFIYIYIYIYIFLPSFPCVIYSFLSPYNDVSQYIYKTYLMMSPKMATPGLLKITIFWNKAYDVIVSVDEVKNKFLARDLNYIVDVFMCSCDQSLVTVAFLSEKLSKPQFYKDLTTKTVFLRGGLGSSLIICDWH